MKRPEEALQRQIITFLSVAVSPLDCLWFHPANGGARSKAEAGILKAMGVRPGVADLVLLLESGKAAFIELKADKGRLSPAQLTFKASVEAMGFPYTVARSLEDVQAFLRHLGVPMRGAIAA